MASKTGNVESSVAFMRGLININLTPQKLLDNLSMPLLRCQVKSIESTLKKDGKNQLISILSQNSQMIDNRSLNFAKIEQLQENQIPTD